MSMLAEPRRKQKVINLRAKNNAWSNDSTKFGQRMLEKMGWSSGKGLGANENGIVEHVVARYKNDEKGLGFEDRNDQWTKHEDDFNALLANLSNDDAGEPKLHSGISLEVKSKKSKARVHYHKFTRGKDLTRYSEKDLANIFGKKSLKNKDKPDDKVFTEEVNNEQESEQFFTEKGSMEDYFKSKLAALKSKSTFTFNNNIKKEEDSTEYVFQGFSTNSDETNERKDQENQPFLFYNNYINSLEMNEQSRENELSNKKKKKKKSKDSKSDQSNVLEVVEVAQISKEEQIENENCHSLEASKKKKKKSKQSDLEVKADNNEQNNFSDLMNEQVKNSITTAEEEIISTKKRKKNIEGSSETTVESVSKKKKKKIKSWSQEADSFPDNKADIDSQIPKKKKTKKNKTEHSL